MKFLLDIQERWERASIWCCLKTAKDLYDLGWECHVFRAWPVMCQRNYTYEIIIPTMFEKQVWMWLVLFCIPIHINAWMRFESTSGVTTPLLTSVDRFMHCPEALSLTSQHSQWPGLGNVYRLCTSGFHPSSPTTVGHAYRLMESTHALLWLNRYTRTVAYHLKANSLVECFYCQFRNSLPWAPPYHSLLYSHQCQGRRALG